MATLVHVNGLHSQVIAASNGNGLFEIVSGSASTTVTSDNTVTWEGSPSLKTATVGTGGYVGLVKDWTASTTLVVGFPFRFDANPTGTVRVIETLFQTGVFTWLQLSTTGTLAVGGTGGTGGVASTSGTLSTGTWYWIDWRVVNNAGTLEIDWQLEGSAMTSTTRSGATSGITSNEVRCGNNASTTGTHWTGPFIVSTTSADYPLGKHKVAKLAPDADGAHSVGTATFKRVINNGTDAGGTTITNSTTDAWGVVDDVPVTADANGSDDWVSKTAGTGTDYVEFHHTDPEANSVPAGVRVVAALRNDTGTTANNAQIHLVEGTTEDSTAAFNASIGSATTIYRTKTFSAKPTTGAWSRTALVDTRTRFRSTNLGAIPRLKAVWLEAAYPVIVTQPQIARPASTTTAGGWTASAGTLHSASSDQSDSTYITGTAA
jgi:hypothetical protein